MQASLQRIWTPLLLLAGLIGCASSPATMKMPAPLPPVEPPGCCGVITPAGARLVAFIDSTGVDHLWMEHVRINWETGEPRAGAPVTHGTHCSAYAAAAARKLGIYILRPPDHSQDFLASAQERWLQTEHAREDGWVPVATPREAQQRANRGELVVIAFRNPEPHRPGHVAIVRPYLKSEAALALEGPETAQAGLHNFSNGYASYSFIMHPGAWPDHVKIFAHRTSFQGSVD